jgi:hypothetical protein
MWLVEQPLTLWLGLRAIGCSCILALSYLSLAVYASISGWTTITWDDCRTGLNEVKADMSCRGPDLIIAWAQSRSSRDIAFVLGEPQHVDGPLDLQGGGASMKTADENWFYNWGHRVVVLSFKDYRCTGITDNHFLYFEYADWRANQIGDYAPGKTDIDILRRFGASTRDEGPIPSCYYATAEAHTADRVWHYVVSDHHGVTLSFKNHRCTSVEYFDIYH